MNSHERQPAGIETQEQYESAVLDFLDKEMAMVQETQKMNSQSEELDALVSDLLKQVITEADQTQTQGSDKPLFDEDELFRDLAPSQKQVAEKAGAAQVPAVEKKAAAPLPTSPTKTAAKVEELKPTAEPETKKEEKPAPAQTVMFGSSEASQRKFPVMAFVAVGIVVTIGAGIYFFSGSSSKAPVNPGSHAAISQSAIPATSNVPAAPVVAPKSNPVRPETKPAASTAAPSAPAKQTAASTVVPSKPNATTTTAAKEPDKPAATNLKTETAQAAAVKTASEEKPAPAQTVAAPPPPVQTAAVEKPSSPAVTEHAPPLATSAPEKKPAPSAQTAGVSEPPAPAAQPVRAAPPVANSLVAAVPIIQSGPIYPEVARRAKLSGSVLLDVQIDDQGKVVKATPVSGPVVLQSAAIAAVSKWRYKPASISGVNVSSQSRVTIAFKMNN